MFVKAVAFVFAFHKIKSGPGSPDSDKALNHVSAKSTLLKPSRGAAHLVMNFWYFIGRRVLSVGNVPKRRMREAGVRTARMQSPVCR